VAWTRTFLFTLRLDDDTLVVVAIRQSGEFRRIPMIRMALRLLHQRANLHRTSAMAMLISFDLFTDGATVVGAAIFLGFMLLLSYVINVAFDRLVGQPLRSFSSSSLSARSGGSGRPRRGGRPSS